MKHLKRSMSLILLLGALALSSLKVVQAQTGDTKIKGRDSSGMGSESGTGGILRAIDTGAKSRGSSVMGSEPGTVGIPKSGDMGAKGRDSSGMGSESGTGGIPR